MDKRLIYAFDFDGTLCNSKFPDCGEPIQEIVNFAKKVKSEGHYIILWTNRCGEPLFKAIDWCAEQGIELDAVNDNLEFMKEYFKNNTRKIFANYYIDDRNMKLEDCK